MMDNTSQNSVSSLRRIKRMRPWPRDVEGPRSFVLFLGFGRSGNSLVGQIINAHRNALVGNEGRLFQDMRGNLSKEFVWSYIQGLDAGLKRRGYKKPGKIGNAQNLFFSGCWQGRFEQPLLVMGNSKAGRTTLEIYEDRESLLRLIDTLGVETKFVLCVRDPNEIAGSMLKRGGAESAGEAISVLADRSHALDGVLAFIRDQGLKVHCLPHELLLDDPMLQVGKLFEFLSLPEDEKLLSAVSQTLYREPEKPSKSYNFTQSDERRLTALIEAHDFFSRYA